MMARAPHLAAACALAFALAAPGCGSSGGGSGGGPDPNDKRAVALQCITKEKGIPARLTGQKSIQVDGSGGPRVEFMVSSGEAEGRQFQGGAQSAEQIGAALLFVRRGSDQQLEKIEACLNDQ